MSGVNELLKRHDLDLCRTPIGAFALALAGCGAPKARHGQTHIQTARPIRMPGNHPVIDPTLPASQSEY